MFMISKTAGCCNQINGSMIDYNTPNIKTSNPEWFLNNLPLSIQEIK